MVLVIVVQLSVVAACPINCICEETQTTCSLTTCNDEISLDYTDFLTVGGKLCQKQREVLNSLSPNTIIILKDDACGKIRNCR